MQSAPIYKRGSDGKLRTWQYEVLGDQYRTIAGIKDGNLVTSAWTTCLAKNAGKANYITAYEQAAKEAAAEEQKKLKREYRRTTAELDNVMKRPMLAHTFKGNVEFPVFSQPKLDGIRALITRDGAFTRELQPHTNVDHILRALKPLFNADPSLILDGELYNHEHKDNFNKIVRMVRKVTPDESLKKEIEGTLQFHLYDIASTGRNFAHRAAILRTIGTLYIDSPTIKVVPTAEATDQENLDALNGIYTSQGYEGQMVRLNAAYEFDSRSKHLLKRKEFETAEFKLLRIEEGTGNWAGHAKRIVFELEDGRECGAGLRGNQEFAKKLLTRKVTEVTIRHFTRTPDGVPRFPVAIDFHEDKRVD